jgi:hypothetical protein
MRITRVSPARGRRPLHVVSDTDERVLEAFQDISAAVEAHRLDLIDCAERQRLVARAEGKLAELGIEVSEDRGPPPQPARPRYRRKRVTRLDEMNRAHFASVIAHWLEVAMIDTDPAGYVTISAEKAAQLGWAARSIAYSIELEKRRGGRR